MAAQESHSAEPLAFEPDHHEPRAVSPSPPLTLPPLPTPFFGRETEITQVRSLLETPGTRYGTRSPASSFR
jgi:hypothetical protein